MKYIKHVDNGVVIHIRINEMKQINVGNNIYKITEYKIDKKNTFLVEKLIENDWVEVELLLNMRGAIRTINIDNYKSSLDTIKEIVN